MVGNSPKIRVVSSGSKYGSKYAILTTYPARMSGTPLVSWLKTPVVGGLLTTYYHTYYPYLLPGYTLTYHGFTDTGSKVVTKNTKKDKYSMYRGYRVRIRTQLSFFRFLLTTLLPGVFSRLETRLNWGVR